MTKGQAIYGTEDKYSSVQQIHVQIVVVLKNWSHIANGSYDRLAGEIWVDFETFKFLNSSLYYLDFYLVNISAMLLIVLEVYFSQNFSNKAFKVYLTS